MAAALALFRLGIFLSVSIVSFVSTASLVTTISTV